MTAGSVAVGVLLVLSLAGGVFTYRGTIGRGPYAGTTKGAFGVGSLLGVFLGLTAGLATLLLVLVLRAAR